MLSTCAGEAARQLVQVQGWVSTIQHTAGLEGLQGDDLKGGARHGRLHRQMPSCADRSRIKLCRAEVAHLLDKRPAEIGFAIAVPVDSLMRRPCAG